MADRANPVHPPSRASRAKYYPLHIHISLFFTLLLLLTGILIGLLNYSGSRQSLTIASREHVNRLAELAGTSLDKLQTPAVGLVRLLSRTALVESRTREERLLRLPLLLEALASNPYLSAVYVGDNDGDFLIVRHLRTPHEIEVFGAPSEARFLIQSLDREGADTREKAAFLDADRKELGGGPELDNRFDPRTRPWYREAASREDPTRTAPYVFFTTRDIGQTFARRAEDERAVVGADITLTALSEGLAAIRPSPSSHLLIVDRDSRIVADSAVQASARTSGEDAPALERLQSAGDPLVREAGRRFPPEGGRAASTLSDGNGREWNLSFVPLGATNDDSMSLVILTPLDESLADAWKQMRRAWVATVLILLFGVPLTWYLSRRVSHDLRTLAGVAESIQHFDFTTDLRLTSWVKEVQILSDNLTTTQTTIRKFLDLSAGLSSERDFSRLEELILVEMLRATGARGGVLYLLSNNGDSLNPATACLYPHGVGEAEEGAGMACSTDLEPLPLAAARPEMAGAMASGEPLTTIIQATALPSALMRDNWGGTRAREILVPLLNNSGAHVGLIALYEGEADGAPPTPGMLAFTRQLSGVAAVALENHRLLLAQEELMRAMIKILAGAIDSKSPYTGGHCQRVPVIAMMLAEAACNAETGPFAGYRLTKDEWDALRVAAWLHDCGKVTTPEYVVDKATKLETIYDRIHEVRMRFEVLKREAEISCLKAKAAGGDAIGADRRLAEEWRSLDDDFAFVAECNLGGEAMRPESQERLARIAKRTWTRTLSDRAGVSWEEKLRRGGEEGAPLPIIEPLLADKPEHLIPRPTGDWTDDHNPWGFNMKRPEFKFNRGELANLSVGRGTLTEEERFIINDHIIQTIIMLSRLPFPGVLRRVPEMAGGHHERMDGKGYPRGLTGAQMSTEARMMAVADVFEALTAADRPYKKAKTLSESLSLMAKMAKAGHLDPSLFELFLRGGVHLRYAKEYLSPQQIDSVDVEGLLTGSR